MKTELLLKMILKFYIWKVAHGTTTVRFPIHKLSIANFQRCEHVSGSRKILCHQGQAWMKSQLTLCLLLLMTLQLYHLAPPIPPPVSNSSCLFTWCQPLTRWFSWVYHHICHFSSIYSVHLEESYPPSRAPPSCHPPHLGLLNRGHQLDGIFQLWLWWRGSAWHTGNFPVV